MCFSYSLPRGGGSIQKKTKFFKFFMLIKFIYLEITCNKNNNVINLSKTKYWGIYCNGAGIFEVKFYC